MSEELETENTNDEYEEISSEEVDRVVETLEQLTESVSSENIRTYLEDVTNTIYTLVYDEEEGEECETEEEVDMEIDEDYDNDMMEEAA